VGSMPKGVVFASDGTKAYVTNYANNIVSVIDTSTSNIITTINVGKRPYGVLVVGQYLYVVNEGSNNVNVIDTSTNKIITTINVGLRPAGISVTPDGKNVYVTNGGSNTVSIINTVTKKVTTTVNVQRYPYAFGQFIGKSVPIITFTKPTDSKSGAILSNIQLGVSSSVPGTFVYNPSTGTVALNVTFIPKDDVNYLQAFNTVPIDIMTTTPVMQITPVVT
jgi:YVTN family beta-propeller protein